MWISLKASCGLGSLVIPGHKIHSKGCVKLTFLCGHRCTHNSGGWRRRWEHLSRALVANTREGVPMAGQPSAMRRTEPTHCSIPALSAVQGSVVPTWTLITMLTKGPSLGSLEANLCVHLPAGVAGVLPFPPSRLISGQGTLRHCPGLGRFPPRWSLVGSLGPHSILPHADVGPWKHCFPGPPFFCLRGDS